jgi:hypothetical protein
MRLCCLHDGFNGTVGLSLSQVLLESVSEDGQLAIGLEATEGLLGLQQAGGGPSELQRMIDTAPAKTLEDAAVKLRRLGAYVDRGQPARLLAGALGAVERAAN